MEFDRDFSEFVALLARHDVQYMIVGGYALAAHGLPRATGDLDAWISTDSANADRLLVALEEFGFGGVGITHDDLTSDDRVVQLGYPPYRIDLLTQISGVDFDAAWTRHIDLVLGKVVVPFIGRDDLIANKRAAGPRMSPTSCLSRETRPGTPVAVPHSGTWTNVYRYDL